MMLFLEQVKASRSWLEWIVPKWRFLSRASTASSHWSWFRGSTTR